MLAAQLDRQAECFLVTVFRHRVASVALGAFGVGPAGAEVDDVGAVVRVYYRGHADYTSQVAPVAFVESPAGWRDLQLLGKPDRLLVAPGFRRCERGELAAMLAVGEEFISQIHATGGNANPPAAGAIVLHPGNEAQVGGGAIFELVLWWHATMISQK